MHIDCLCSFDDCQAAAAGWLPLLERRGGLMVSAPDSIPSGPGSIPGWGHCVVFLGNTRYSHSASLHPGV